MRGWNRDKRLEALDKEIRERARRQAEKKERGKRQLAYFIALCAWLAALLYFAMGLAFAQDRGVADVCIEVGPGELNAVLAEYAPGEATIVLNDGDTLICAERAPIAPIRLTEPSKPANLDNLDGIEDNATRLLLTCARAIIEGERACQKGEMQCVR